MKKSNYNAMKRKPLILIVTLILTSVVSCDDPVTVVTNIVHPDGSVTRKIEMRNIVNKFENSSLQVPFNNSWVIKDTMEISEKGDTTWIKTAEKLFKNVGEINMDYKQDSGANKDISRYAGFKKTFKWFNTEFRYSETIDKKMTYGYPVSAYLNKEELLYFRSPAEVQEAGKNGADSTKVRALNDSVDIKTEKWLIKSLVSEWIGEFSEMTKNKDGARPVIDSLKLRENDFYEYVKIANEKESGGDKFDSLWTNGILLKKFIGNKNYELFKAEADTALEKASGNVWVNFKGYSVRIAMPGSLIGTNGFLDSSKVLIWPVKSEYFLTEPYEMWAESKIPNRWAWIVSGVFLVFVLTGIIIRINKKG